MEFVEHCQKIAQKHFAIPTLRPAQTEVFQLLHEKKFVLATLPTGSGKTLLYAAPSLIFDEGPVIVISPLISLMRDQMRRMEDAKIPCVLFTSDQSESERKKSNFDLWDTNTKIIFVSPERFVLPAFFKKLTHLSPSMIVIDEAHCVISWGHQFRPEYSEIGKYLSHLKPIRVLAVTATAGGATRQEMIRKIFPENVMVSQFVSNPIGKHIFIKSVRTFSFEEQKERLMHILQATTSKKSIVYFSTRKQCEEYAIYIKSKKLNAVVYHAGLAKESRLHIENYIHNTDQKTVVCATTAFGLGVDILDVTLVVIYGFPGNIEEFLQMVGRAGRNGQPSEGILLWTGSDPVKRNHQFKELFPSPSIFLEHCQKISTFFPKCDWEKQFILKEQMLQTIFPTFKNKNREKMLEGFLGALRVCQMIQEVLPHENYYQIKLAKNVSIANILAELPQIVTKRQKVFEGIKILIHKNLFEALSANIILSTTELMDATELSHQTLDDVFSHYTTQKSLSFAKIDSNQAKYGVIIKNGFQMLRKNLEKYISARQHFSSSLQELTKLAEAPRCRLESSFQYFQLPTIRKQANYCLQCDLCQHYKRM